MRSFFPAAVAALGSVFLAFASLTAQNREAVVVEDSRQVLDEVMSIPVRAIPGSLLQNAQGIVIIPDLVKGGFVVGARYGRGIVMVRDERGAWRPPSFVTMAGGSFGWQIGVQVTDIVLVFKTRNSVQGLLSGKFTLGADAAAAAGPVGREAAAATDASLQAEIYTYSRSRGLFAGVSLDGSVLQIDHAANSLYYRGANVTDPNLSIPLSPSVMNLMRQVSLYTGAPSGATANAAPALAPTSMSLPGGTPAQVAPTAAAPRAAPPTLPAAMPVGGDVQFARQRLAESSMQLYAVLDGNWRSYLAMPAEIYAGDRAPSAQSIQQTLSRFDGVARDPRYAALSQRAEFRATHEWLTRYVASSR